MSAFTKTIWEWDPFIMHWWLNESLCRGLGCAQLCKLGLSAWGLFRRAVCVWDTEIMYAAIIRTIHSQCGQFIHNYGDFFLFKN